MNEEAWIDIHHRLKKSSWEELLWTYWIRNHKKKLKVLEKWAWSLNEGFDDNERNEQQPEVDEVTRWRLIARVFLAHFAMLDLNVAVALRSLRLDRLADIGFAAVKLAAAKRD